MELDKEYYKERFEELKEEGFIVHSTQTFKIKLFIQKAQNSIQIAHYIKTLEPTEEQPTKLHWNYWAITISYYSMLYAAKAAILNKGYEAKTHEAVQTALGYLLVPTQIEKEDHY